MKKIILTILLLSAFVFVLVWFAFFRAPQGEEFTPIFIATCDTCYHEFKDKISAPFELIRTQSTGESLDLLKAGTVELAIAGRTPKETEFAGDGIVLRKGYSFLGSKEEVVLFSELSDYNLYSDLPPSDIKNLSLKNVTPVEDIYPYLDQGIAITSWENTDYKKAEIVHIFKAGMSRLPLSRQPTLHCKQTCAEGAGADLLKSLTLNEK